MSGMVAHRSLSHRVDGLSIYRAGGARVVDQCAVGEGDVGLSITCGSCGDTAPSCRLVRGDLRGIVRAVADDDPNVRTLACATGQDERRRGLKPQDQTFAVLAGRLTALGFTGRGSCAIGRDSRGELVRSTIDPVLDSFLLSRIDGVGAIRCATG